MTEKWANFSEQFAGRSEDDKTINWYSEKLGIS